MAWSCAISDVRRAPAWHACGSLALGVSGTINVRTYVLANEIHHAPWPLQTAEAELISNTMPEAAEIYLAP
jgi:hypothetical protein